MEYKTEGFLYSIIFFSYRIRIIKLYIYNVAIKLKKYKQKKIYIYFIFTHINSYFVDEYFITCIRNFCC